MLQIINSNKFVSLYMVLAEIFLILRFSGDLRVLKFMCDKNYTISLTLMKHSLKINL